MFHYLQVLGWYNIPPYPPMASRTPPGRARDAALVAFARLLLLLSIVATGNDAMDHALISSTNLATARQRGMPTARQRLGAIRLRRARRGSGRRPNISGHLTPIILQQPPIRR